MPNIFQNIWPLQAKFNVHNGSAYGQPPVNDPLPNHILPPGATPHYPQRAIPSSPGNLKAALNSLPSILSLNVKG